MGEIKPSTAPDFGFAGIAQLIAAAKQRAVQAVNTTLIELYWQIGQRISQKIAAAECGIRQAPKQSYLSLPVAWLGYGVAFSLASIAPKACAAPIARPRSRGPVTTLSRTLMRS